MNRSGELSANEDITRPYATTALLAAVFTIPSSTFTFLYVFVYLLMLLVFTLFVFLQTRKAEYQMLLGLKQQQPIVYYLLLLFAVSSFVSWLGMVLADVGFEQKVLGSIRYVVYWLLAFYSFMLLRLCLLYKLSHETIYQVFVAGVCFLIFLFIASYFFNDAPNALRWNTEPPFTGNIRTAGMLAATAIIISVVAICLGSYRLPTVTFYYTALFLCSTFLVWTGSRMSLIACWLTVFFLLVMSRVWLRIAWAKIGRVSALIAISLPLAEFLSLPWGGLHRIVGFAQKSIASDNALETFSNNRLDVWKSALDAGVQKLYFGHGPFGYLFVDDGIARPQGGHTHNLFLELFVEWGVIGASLFVLFLLTLAVIGLKDIKCRFQQRDVAWLMSASVVFLLSVNAMADGAYFLLSTMFILVTAFVSFPLLGESGDYATSAAS